MPTASQTDPRSIITPDAFELSTDLVGMPLASPRRRAAALAIDGVVIVLITAATRSLPLLLGVAAAVFFIRAGFKRTRVRGSVFGRAMRLSVGCLGLFIALITVLVGVSVGPRFDRDTELDPRETATRVLTGLAAAGLLGEMGEADSLEEARAAAVELLDVVEDADFDDELVREALLEIAPESAPWRGAWAATVDSLMAPEREVVPVDRTAVEEEIDALTDAEAVARLATLVAADDDDEPGADVGDDAAETRAAERAALSGRVRALVAGDSIARLERRVASLEDRVVDAESARAGLEAEVQAFEDRGLLSRLRDLANDLGFGFGWAALYMTVVLSWWNGQTVGKRAMRIRVVRLDGEPITWWVAFERVGGYAAGLATGLLGFAQVWWDANRQAIHDRIVGTVVIYDGAEKVLDWESAL